MNFRERILATPLVYKSFKNIVSPQSSIDRIVKEHFVFPEGSRILDLGCGYGDFAPYLSKDCDYLGVDNNQKYIETARIRNRDNGANFLVGDISDEAVFNAGEFDYVVIIGVLHHLPTEAIQGMLKNVQRILSTSGKFVALEPVFDSDQRLLARLLIAADRGRFVRDSEGYEHLLKEYFSEVTSSVVTGLLRIPYSHVFLEASK